MVRSPLYGFCAVLTSLTLLASTSAMAGKNILNPENAWLVGPTKVASASGSCMMSNQYENGFYMNFTGDQSGLENLRVDFRQPSFKSGREYDVGFVVPPNYTTNVKGTAYNTAGLEFDFTGQEELAQQIQSSSLVYMKVGHTVVPFSTQGIGEGIERLSSCAGGGLANIQPAAGPTPEAQPTQQVANEQKPLPLLKIEDQAEEVAVQYVKPIAPAEPIQEQKPKELIIPMRERLALPVPSEKAGNNEIVISMPNRKPEQIRSSEGPQNLTAQQQEYREKSNMEPLPVREVEAVDVAAIRYSDTPKEQDWQALQGLSLRDTLLGWSQREGVDLIWDSESDFSVLDTISIDTNYETAVSEVLEQYSTAKNRPFGRLHVDPDTGARVLLVQDQNRI